jgi:hypothetical protein
VISHRLLLVLAGAAAVAAIGFATILRHAAQVPASALVAALLGTYAVGLVLGRLALGARG